MANFSNDNYEHHNYKHDKDIPFTTIDNEPDLHRGPIAAVFKVIGTSGTFKNLLAVRKSIQIKEGEIRKIKKEAKILHRARHEHVVRLIMTYVFKDRFSIIMDRADGNLGDYLKIETIRINREKIPYWFGCLISVVTYIHGQGIYHRDIKPANILIKNDKVLLADFGISAIGLSKVLSKKESTTHDGSHARTVMYCAPEVENGHTRRQSADIFSLGAVFLEMLIASSYPTQFQNLRNVISTPDGSPGACQSYAKQLHKVHEWMAYKENELKPVQWCSIVLGMCVKMLQENHEDRPKADDLNLWWKLQPSTIPLRKCNCTQPLEDPKLCSLGTMNETLRTSYEKGHRLMICWLNGRDAVISDKDVLVAASKGEMWDIVKHLIKKGVDVSAEDRYGRTALHYAAEYGCQEVVKLLLERGADIDAADEMNKSVLRVAAENGHRGVIYQLLMSKSQDLSNDINNQSELGSEERGSMKDMIKRLLIDTGKISGQSSPPKVIQYRHEILNGLLRNYHPNHYDGSGQMPLSEASVHLITDILMILFERDTNIAAKARNGERELLRVATYGHEVITRMLLDSGVHIETSDEYGQTPLLRAAMHGHEAVVRLLLDKGANIEAKDQYGQTPLSRAVMYGHETIVRLLLEEDANIEAKDEHKQTPLLSAATHGHGNIVRILLEKGAHVEAKDRHKQTPLLKAATEGHEMAVRLLLDKGANIGATDSDGWTPLTKAIGAGHRAAQDLLHQQRTMQTIKQTVWLMAASPFIFGFLIWQNRIMIGKTWFK